MAEGAIKSGFATRRVGKILALAATTLVCLHFSFELSRPFLPAIVWAVSLAVITRPWIERRFGRMEGSSRRAAAAVLGVASTLFGPIVGIGYVIAAEIGHTVGQWQENRDWEQWLQTIKEHPQAGSAYRWLSRNVDLETAAGQVFEQVREGAMTIVSGGIYTALQSLLTLFILYYLYRDGDQALAAVKRYLPLSDGETDRLLKRLDDTIHATVFGTIVVAMVQGALGGFMFWVLGLSAPLLWGFVMGLLAIVPYLGAFVVWAPAAAALALRGDWGKAALLAGWGTIVVGMIDNLLYPTLVGGRLKQHTVVSFLAIVGGIATFGGMGIILGPAVVSLTFFLLEVWRRRTAGGTAAETV